MIDNYLKHLPNKTVLLPAFGLKDWVKQGKDFCLFDIAEFTEYKGPINHMTEIQNITLANQVHEYFKTGDYSKFNLKAYKL